MPDYRRGGAYLYPLAQALGLAYRTPAGWAFAQGVTGDGSTRLFAALEPDGQISVSRERVPRRQSADYAVPDLVAVPDHSPLLRGSRWCPLRGDDERGPVRRRETREAVTC